MERRKLNIIPCLLLLISSGICNAQLVSTFAGQAGTAGFADGIGNNARFHAPSCVVIDKSGNIFIADRLNQRIRKISPSRAVSVYAGTGSIGSADGPALAASFNEPAGIACDTAGNLYIADNKNYKVRKIDTNGNVSTVAGTGVFGNTNGPASTARFGSPTGIAVSADGRIIYVSEYNTHVIRKIENGQVTTPAGSVFLPGNTDGTGAAASFDHPFGLCLENNGDLLIADEFNHKIRRMSPSGTVTTVLGTGTAGNTNGSAATAQLNYPGSVCIDTLSNMFITESSGHTIRKFSPLTGQVISYAGNAGLSGTNDGSGPAARFNKPGGIFYNRNDRAIYVADQNNHTIRRVVFLSSIVLTLNRTGNTPLCAGNPVNFTVAPSGLSNYTITNNGVIIGQSANGNISLSGLAAGTYSFQANAIDNQGATAFSSNLNLTVLPAFTPIINSSGGSAICNGSALTLTSGSAVTYQWSTGATTPNLVVNSAGTYTVTATNASGCSGTSQPFTVTVQASPAAQITAPDTTVCPGSTALLTASAATAWLWSNGATTQSINAGAGTYSVTVTGAGGCTATSSPKTVVQENINTPQINPSGTVVIPQGASVVLQASGGTTYLWSNNATSSSITVSNSGSYSVVTTGAGGCTATSTTVQVTVITPQNMISVAGATTICEGTSTILNSVFASSNQWYYNSQPIPGATDQQVQVSDSGWYYVSVTYGNNTIKSDSIRINVLPSPDVPFANDTNICNGRMAVINLPPSSGITYRWYDGDPGGTLVYSGNTYVSPPVTAFFTVYVEAISAQGCTSQGRMDIDVNPVAVALAGFDYVVTPENGQYEVTFNALSPDATGWLWIFGDTTGGINQSTNESTIFTYDTQGSYEVTLVTYNANGCSDTLKKVVFAGIKIPPFVPTTFTPNGDGRNDLFRVRSESWFLQEMRIYDQWGTLVFQTDSARPEWDGRINGKVVQNGTYVYRIRIADTENNTQDLTGPITVIK